MKMPVDYGVYLWWPTDGESTFHPDDVQLARKLIPSRRVFHRERFLDPYVVVTYGPHRLRIKPILFLPVRNEGFDIGNLVQVLSRCGNNWPFIGRVAEMLWHVQEKRIEYGIRRVDRLVPHFYSATDLQRVKCSHDHPVILSLPLSDATDDREEYKVESDPVG